ncbi:MAG: hypothetical protein M3179_01325 [Actinomycetota bacterium]|nr:hypothetical protein [Actinomycetota bacterium]
MRASRVVANINGYCTTGEGAIEDWVDGYTRELHVVAETATTQRGPAAGYGQCAAVWGVPEWWLWTYMYVFDSGRFCESFRRGNNLAGHAIRLRLDHIWYRNCFSARPWLTIDAASFAWNPNAGGFWQGDWVYRPTAGHQF